MSRSLAPSPTASVSSSASAEPRAQLDQRRELGFAAENRLADLAGQQAAVEHEALARVSSKPIIAAIGCGEKREAARDQHGIGAVGAHGATRVAAPGVSATRSRITSPIASSRQALEHRDPLAQCRLESDFAAHGALGDRGDLGLHAGEIRQFVHAFLADHGGIHVGEEQPLAAVGGRLHDHIDAFGKGAQFLGEAALVKSRACAKGDVGGARAQAVAVR